MLDFLFSQYKEYSTLHLVLEIIAVIFGFISVFCAKKNNILVYPSGIVSTLIFVYLLFQWNFIGDMLINIYYTSMSIYGWFLWQKKNNNTVEYPISYTSKKEWKTAFFIFIFTLLFVVAVYIWFNLFNSVKSYIDTFTTGIFFVGMWLMAKRKIENWILWIIGDIISVPLYFNEGYTFTALQFFIFTFIAYFGYKEWKTYLTKTTTNK